MLLALRTAPPSIAAAEGERIARDVYGLAVTAHALSGERDCNFHLHTADGHEYVLKILDIRADAGGADCLAAVLSHLAEQNPALPVPRVFPTLRGADIGRLARDGQDLAVCLTNYLPGKLLDESRLSSMLLRNIGSTLGTLDSALQGFGHAALSRELVWDPRRLGDLAQYSGYIASKSTRVAVENMAAVVRDRLPQWRALRSQAIHGDCHGRNLLADNSGSLSGILDFGDLMHAPVIFEPAIAMSELLVDGLVVLRDAGLIVQGFAQTRLLETREVDSLFELIGARHAVTLLVHAWRARHDPRGAALLEDTAARAARSLGELLDAGGEALTLEWHRAAGTEPGGKVYAVKQSALPVDIERRHRLLGAGAELFYETPLHIVRGEGVWLFDADGRRYLDVYNNVPHVGHSHPTVVAAIARQTAVLATHTRYLHELILEYAERLTRTLPAHLDTCIFVNSGSEANDVAWRIAKMASGNAGAMVMANAYHGITDAAGALTPGAGAPTDPWVVTLTPPPAELCATDSMHAACLTATREDTRRALRLLAGRGYAPAALFLDSALTSSGIFDPPADWIHAVADDVRGAGGLMVADEVQYGLGRSGSHFWGFERRGLTPDIVTLGKPVGNGYPMGVVIANRSLIEAFQARFGFFSTFGGNAVAAAAGLAVLRVLEQEQLMANAETSGAYLRAGMRSLAARHRLFGEVRGHGLLLGLTVRGATAGAAKLNTRHIVNILTSEFSVLIGSEGPQGNILKLRPPMPFRPEHADALLAALHGAAAIFDASS